MLGCASTADSVLQSIKRLMVGNIENLVTFAIALSSTNNSDRPVDPSSAIRSKIFPTCCSLIFKHVSWLPVNTCIPQLIVANIVTR